MRPTERGIQLNRWLRQFSAEPQTSNGSWRTNRGLFEDGAICVMLWDCPACMSDGWSHNPDVRMSTSMERIAETCWDSRETSSLRLFDDTLSDLGVASSSEVVCNSERPSNTVPSDFTSWREKKQINEYVTHMANDVLGYVRVYILINTAVHAHTLVLVHPP